MPPPDPALMIPLVRLAYWSATTLGTAVAVALLSVPLGEAWWKFFLVGAAAILARALVLRAIARLALTDLGRLADSVLREDEPGAHFYCLPSDLQRRLERIAASDRWTSQRQKEDAGADEGAGEWDHLNTVACAAAEIGLDALEEELAGDEQSAPSPDELEEEYETPISSRRRDLVLYSTMRLRVVASVRLRKESLLVGVTCWRFDYGDDVEDLLRSGLCPSGLVLDFYFLIFGLRVRVGDRVWSQREKG